MIDLDDFLDSLHSEIKDYTGVPQLLLGTEDISDDFLVYPRGRMYFSTKYTPQSRQSFIEKMEFVPSEESGFEKDIEYTYLMYPETTLSIEFFGEDVTEFVNSAREWFMIKQLGRRFLDSYGKCVIRDITNTQNRKTFLETNYEDRQGFDVFLVFEDKVKVTEKTIEKVQFSFNGEDYEVDI